MDALGLRLARATAPPALVEAAEVIGLALRRPRTLAALLVVWFAHAGYAHDSRASPRMRAVASTPWLAEPPFRVVTLQQPHVDWGDALVEVRAVSVNPVDRVRAMLPWVPFARWYAPVPQLQDFSGVLRRSLCGKADALPVGTHVYGATTRGSLAEYALVGCDHVARAPRALSHAQAAALPTVAFPGIVALRGRVRPGATTVLVMGASSACGQFGVRYARALGARRVACVASKAKLERAVAVGCDAALTFDYRSPAFEVDVLRALRGQVDVVYDAVSSFDTDDYYPVLHETLSSAATAGGAKAYVGANGLLTDWARLLLSRALGVDLQKPGFELASHGHLARDLDAVRDLALGLLPDVAQVSRMFNASHVSEAMHRVRDKHPGGKLVLEM